MLPPRASDRLAIDAAALAGVRRAQPAECRATGRRMDAVTGGRAACSRGLRRKSQKSARARRPSDAILPPAAAPSAGPRAAGTRGPAPRVARFNLRPLHESARRRPVPAVYRLVRRPGGAAAAARQRSADRPAPGSTVRVRQESPGRRQPGRVHGRRSRRSAVRSGVDAGGGARSQHRYGRKPGRQSPGIGRRPQAHHHRLAHRLRSRGWQLRRRRRLACGDRGRADPERTPRGHASPPCR